MRVLIAEDDVVVRRLLEASLVKWGYEVVVVCDGSEAWEVLAGEDSPELVLLDWMMPGMDGLEVCRRVKSRDGGRYVYVIMLTAKRGKGDVAVGLDAGADDYVTKPFSARELRARVNVGMRMLNLQRSLEEHVKKLEEALSRVKKLQGLLPICSYCKRIRNDENYWQQVEAYVAAHSDAQFSHSICPDCYERLVNPEFEKIKTPQ